MRWVLIILFLSAVGIAGFGFYTKPDDLQGGHLFIGLGVSVFSFLWMPLFLYHRWKGKSAKDYMLTKENLHKMREFKDGKRKQS